MRRLCLSVILVTGLALASVPAFAQSAGCTIVTNASANAAENEIQFLRNNVRRPQSIGALTCLTLFASISNLSADAIVMSFIEDIFGQIISQVCSALNGYWQAVLNQARCSISVGVGLDFGSGGLGGGSFCKLDLGNGGGLTASGSFGLGASGGGYYVHGLAPEIPPYGQ